MDTLDDYDDPVTTCHALKNVLRSYTIIPKLQQAKLLVSFSTPKSNNPEKITKLKDILARIPDKNFECLKIILAILHRVIIAQQKSLPPSKALTVSGISIIFSAILFDPEEDITRVNLKSSCVAFLIENRMTLMEQGM